MDNEGHRIAQQRHRAAADEEGQGYAEEGSRNQSDKADDRGLGKDHLADLAAGHGDHPQER